MAILSLNAGCLSSFFILKYNLTLESQVINQLHLVAKKPYWEDDGMTPNMFTNSLCGMVVAEHKGEQPQDITSLTSWIRGPNAAWMDQVDERDAIAAVVADIERLRPAAKGALEVSGGKRIPVP